MRSILTLSILLLTFASSVAQTTNPVINNYTPFRDGVSVGKTTKPVASAVLEMQSTTKGVLFPRMTEAQKNAISAPATGLVVYQTDGTSGVYVWDGADWVDVGSGGGESLWQAEGGVLSPISEDTVQANYLRSTDFRFGSDSVYTEQFTSDDMDFLWTIVKAKNGHQGVMAFGRSLNDSAMVFVVNTNMEDANYAHSNFIIEEEAISLSSEGVRDSLGGRYYTTHAFFDTLGFYCYVNSPHGNVEMRLDSAAAFVVEGESAHFLLRDSMAVETPSVLLTGGGIPTVVVIEGSITTTTCDTVASSSTITLGSSNNVVITGTADIDSINTASSTANFQIVYIEFTGTAAVDGLTDGTNILLEANMSYLPTATVTLQRRGNYFYELSRSGNGNP